MCDLLIFGYTSKATLFKTFFKERVCRLQFPGLRSAEATLVSHSLLFPVLVSLKQEGHLFDTHRGVSVQTLSTVFSSSLAHT